VILLSPADWRSIAAAAEAAFPGEGCGLLVGQGGDPVQVTRVVPAINLCAGERNDRFELDPAARFAVQRTLRGTAERMVGHWHSHPNGRAFPSAEDLARAAEPDLIWLIVPVQRDETGSPRAGLPGAFRLDATTGQVEPLTLLGLEGADLADF